VTLTALLLAQTLFGCMPHSRMVDLLGDKYGEASAGIGVSGYTAFELFQNPKTKSWTFIRTTTSGVSCLIASGSAWHPVAYKTPGRNL